MLTITILCLAPLLFLLGLTLHFRRKTPVNQPRGPLAPSMLFGFEPALQGGKSINLLYNWTREYGPAYMLPVCFWERLLVISDPWALHKIFNECVDDYPETGALRALLNNCFGPGVFWATGDDHRRHRKILNPAFSMNNLRQFIPIFRKHVNVMCEKWASEVQSQRHGFDVVPWLHKIALDNLGESSFNYQFDAMENKADELTKALSDIETEGPPPSPMTTLIMAASRRMPGFIASFKSNHWPALGETLALQYQQISHAKGRELLSLIKREESSSDKDILSLLVRANATEDEKKGLSEEEVLAQISTFIQAGHHTTGYTIAWILYELAAHPEDQAKVYEQITAVRAGNRGELSAPEYDSITHLSSVIKEALRLHPILTTMERTAVKNGILPLNLPVVSTSGHQMTSVLVKKGQRILVDVATYNRLESVWGQDPNAWKPHRHDYLNLASNGEKPTALGIYGNILTFSSGPKSCIGWRFAGVISFKISIPLLITSYFSLLSFSWFISILEMQVVIAGLMEKYEFRVPTNVEIDPITTFLLVPSVREREAEGPQLPLVVTPRSPGRE